MKLAIISHTKHYLKDGQIVGWEPTIKEINHLTELFDEIYHVAVLYDTPAPYSTMPYSSNRIHFIPLKPFGGPKWQDKLTILIQMPSIVGKVRSVLKKVDWFHFRAPTGIGVFLIPYLSWFCKKQGWYKYAGNWVQEKPPLGYKFQRFFLAYLQHRKVTINGYWKEQPKHCISFENPCLSEEEIEEGGRVILGKVFYPPFNFCFVGRLEDAKGVNRILEAFNSPAIKKITQYIHIVGDGIKRQVYQHIAKENALPVIFHGFLPKNQINDIYSQSYFFVLPSESEGFPKALAEAANYGLIPIVTAVSAIPHYVTDEIGYLWNPNSISFADFVEKIDFTITEQHNAMAIKAHQLAKKFTYNNYLSNIKNKILE